VPGPGALARRRGRYVLVVGDRSSTGAGKRADWWGCGGIAARFPLRTLVGWADLRGFCLSKAERYLPTLLVPEVRVGPQLPGAVITRNLTGAGAHGCPPGEIRLHYASRKT
jgi:hypothetical protein